MGDVNLDRMKYKISTPLKKLQPKKSPAAPPNETINMLLY